MISQTFFSVIFISLYSDIYISCQKLVTIPQGTLEGVELTNENGKNLTGFRGIPYAEPPLGDLKFKPPQPAKPWEGTYNATVEGNICKGSNIFTGEIQGGEEDCLFLNTYVPETSSDEPLPVFFWIYSGGFIYMSGNAVRNGPEYLMDYDVIFVTFNYRLGPLGFLNLELADCPGNMGLMDQVMALKWVNDNIEYFGGDPSRITIGGAASAHYLVLSDLTSGLFQRAIVEGGSALNPWAFQEYHMKRAFQLTAGIGYNTTDPEEALQYLKNAPVDDLYSVQMPPEVPGQLIENYVFVPTVEKVFPTHEPFLPESPLSRMISGNFNKVPLLTGFNNGEGIMFFMYINFNPDLLEDFEADFQQFIPHDLNIELNTTEAQNLSDQMREFYFQNKTVPDDLHGFVDIMGDNWILRGVDKHVKLTLKNTAEPVYYYEYYFAVAPPTLRLYGDYNQTRAAHGDELVNFLNGTWMDLATDIPSVVLNQQRVLEMWTNFIKFGDPTPEVTDILPVKWLPATNESLNYLSINETFSMGVYPEQERMEFWENVEAKIESGSL